MSSPLLDVTASSPLLKVASETTGISAYLAREAPNPSPLERLRGRSHPAVPDEPVFDVDNIQGNSIAGFSKDFQTLLVLTIDDVAAFKPWLQGMVPFIASAAEVIAFNRLFKAIRTRQKVESNTVQATWVNIAFSHEALLLLTAGTPFDLTVEPDFVDAAFTAGLAAKSEELGDPTDPSEEGHRNNWEIGGPNNDPAHVLVIVASDAEDDLADRVDQIEMSLAGMGAHVAFKEEGRNLPKDSDPDKDLSGHEHFGNLDGVSQPGLRGRVSNNVHDVLTPRQNPNDPEQGKPGQDLLWPGEFVFGYPGQLEDPADDVADPGPLSFAGPSWAADGSFLVFRRLRQDVFGFHTFLNGQAGGVGLTGAGLSAKVVGRWRSGAPIERAPAEDLASSDIPDLGADDCANNNFEFEEDADPIPPAGNPDPFDCVDVTFDVAEEDPVGLVCPLAGHIRKAYPRDDTSTIIASLGETTTQTHRILRRGIPFGEANTASSPDNPVDDGITDRGLLFLAYQTSIDDQFEFIIKNWVNNRNFKENDAGHDLVIGQNNEAGQGRQREFTVITNGVQYTVVAGDTLSDIAQQFYGDPNQFRLIFQANRDQIDDPDLIFPGQVLRIPTVHTLNTNIDWVIPTGGEYFFAPSIEALADVLSG